MQGPRWLRAPTRPAPTGAALRGSRLVAPDVWRSMREAAAGPARRSPDRDGHDAPDRDTPAGEAQPHRPSEHRDLCPAAGAARARPAETAAAASTSAASQPHALVPALRMSDLARRGASPAFDERGASGTRSGGGTRASARLATPRTKGGEARNASLLSPRHSGRAAASATPRTARRAARVAAVTARELEQWRASGLAWVYRAAACKVRGEPEPELPPHLAVAPAPLATSRPHTLLGPAPVSGVFAGLDVASAAATLHAHLQECARAQ